MGKTGGRSVEAPLVAMPSVGVGLGAGKSVRMSLNPKRSREWLGGWVMEEKKQKRPHYKGSALVCTITTAYGLGTALYMGCLTKLTHSLQSGCWRWTACVQIQALPVSSWVTSD